MKPPAKNDFTPIGDLARGLVDKLALRSGKSSWTRKAAHNNHNQKAEIMTTKLAVSSSEVRAIHTIVDHFLRNERKDYEEDPRPDHIVGPLETLNILAYRIAEASDPTA